MANREYAKKYHRDLKAEMIEAYGGMCECCGETIKTFLTLDHINNDGAEHRKLLGINSKCSNSIWLDLKRKGWPKDNYRLLCFNCNSGRAKNVEGGYICPHEEMVSGFLRLPPKTVKQIVSNYQSKQLSLLSLSCITTPKPQ
jgi:hypothetical protein